MVETPRNLERMTDGGIEQVDDTIDNEISKTKNPAKGVEKSDTAINSKAVDGDREINEEDESDIDISGEFYDAVDDLCEYMEEFLEVGDEGGIIDLIEGITNLIGGEDPDIEDIENTPVDRERVVFEEVKKTFRNKFGRK